MGRTWTQAPSYLPPHPFFGQGDLALRSRFLRFGGFGFGTPFPFCDSIRPYNPGASAPLFPDRQVGLSTAFQPAACASHLGLAGLYDHSDTLTTGTSVPVPRPRSFAPVAGGIYARALATSVSLFLEAGWALRPQPNPFTTGTLVPHTAFTATAGGQRAIYL